jgi:predicted metal-dependent enzyme (double-stranded beta helix superfamily)
VTVVFDGMHGLGDNVHQRALVRRVLASRADVWLHTPWPCLYHDLVGEMFHVLPPTRTTLRTQHKNLLRERDRYTSERPHPLIGPKKIWYDTPCIRASDSILGGMLRYTLRQPLDGADFSLPVPDAWRAKAMARIARPDRPIMVLRPLVDRKEWGGCATRNPDPKAYAALYNAIRSRFFVVSIADLVDRVEWICGDNLRADVTLHAGELDTETMIGMFASAAITFCSPGFALILSQAVGTPVICVYGGRESSRYYAYGARFAPTLGIDPVRPCDCFLPKHQCDKYIDLDKAHADIARFLDTDIGQHEIRRRAG